MVIYSRTDKTLIIPDGFGDIISGGSHSDCSEAIEQAKAEQAAEDARLLHKITITDAGVYEPYYGYNKVTVEGRILEPEIILVFDDYHPVNEFGGGVPISLNGKEYRNSGAGRILTGGQPQLWVSFYTSQASIYEQLVISVYWTDENYVWDVTPIGVQFGRLIDPNNIDLTDKVTVTTEAVAGRTTWTITPNEDYIAIVDWQSYLEGLSACQNQGE